jgi:hypothetical protein
MSAFTVLTIHSMLCIQDKKGYSLSGGEDRSTKHFFVKPWVVDEFNRVIHEFHV